jgi:hypothetical protein
MFFLGSIPKQFFGNGIFPILPVVNIARKKNVLIFFKEASLFTSNCKYYAFKFHQV